MQSEEDNKKIKLIEDLYIKCRFVNQDIRTQKCEDCCFINAMKVKKINFNHETNDCILDKTLSQYKSFSINKDEIELLNDKNWHFVMEFHKNVNDT